MNNSNTQDIFFRNLSISLLDLLNRTLEIELWRDGKPEIHTIPFYYNSGVDEGFMQDFFIGIPPSCKIAQMAEGNYDPIPRGILTLASFQVKTGEITNKFGQSAFYVKKGSHKFYWALLFVCDCIYIICITKTRYYRFCK